MNKTGIFTIRNTKEMLRSPSSWLFGMVMPVGILTIMQIIIKSLGSAAQNVPMFAIDRFTGGVIVFGASFLTMFCVLLLSRDRSESFLVRLYASPMRPCDYILGYALSLLPLMFIQIFLTFITALLFGLTPSWHILSAVFLSAVSSLMFIAIGILFGSLFGEKSAGPICSVVVQFAALFSGMWFDLSMIGGGFSVFCKALPFANAYDIIRFSLAGDYSKIWVPLAIVLGYTALFSGLAAAAFKRKMRSN